MQRWISLLVVLGAILIPRIASAQTPTDLASLSVQLLPEYDQASMLVIYDFQLPSGTKLPVNISIRFPKEAKLFAVASVASDASFRNADYLGPSVGDTWQTVTVQVQTQTTYHIEYYQPLSKSGSLREFSYLWPGDYPVKAFGVSVRIPVDATQMTTKPATQAAQGADGVSYMQADFGALAAGQQFPLTLSYTKTSDTLSASQQDLRPSQPLGAKTSGRVMLSNYLPYIIGVLGFVLVAGGAVYFWQSGRGGRRAAGRRHRPASHADDEDNTDVYCHQCGTRAHAGDRFCRVCGTKLRLPE
jgi:hypothetical protein